MRGRFFQRLQQTVESLLRQHVYFVDDVDLVARRRRGIARALDDLANVVDAGAGGGIHFLHVDKARFGNRPAWLANAARIDGRRGALAVRSNAVEGAGDNARGGGLSHAAHAGQHEGVGDTAGGECVAQRADQGFLPDQPGEIGRAVFARQHTIRLGTHRGGGRAQRRPAWRRVVEAQTWLGSLVHVRLSAWKWKEAGERPETALVTAASFRT